MAKGRKPKEAVNSLSEVSAIIEEARRTNTLELNLSGRDLTSLPESISQLSQLLTLYLDDNQLTSLPESLRKLDKLSELYLHDNEALRLPAAVLGPSWREVMEKQAEPANPAAILEYYFRAQSGKRPLNEAKLILVGRGAVGKTSIVNKLVHNRFDKGEKKTEGIRITEWPIRLNADEDVLL